MLNISKMIIKTLEERGSSQMWLYEEMNKNMEKGGMKTTGYKNFNRKLKEDSFTPYEFLYIAKILGINLNELKKLI